jgi:two-component system, cell cycle sensor histidine kinase and response regulator CckA
MTRQEDETGPYHTLRHVRAGVMVQAADSRIVFANDEACRLLGRPAEQVLGRPIADIGWSLAREDGTPMAPDEYSVAGILSAGRPVRDVVIGVNAGGRRLWLLVSASLENDRGDAAGARLVVTFIDITEQRFAQERQAHVATLLRTVRSVDELIRTEKHPEALLSGVCDLLTGARGYRSAWIALLTPDGGLRVAAGSGMAAGFAAMRARAQAGGWPRCCTQALARPRAVTVHDPETDCRECPMAPAYRGMAALACTFGGSGSERGVLVVALPAAMAREPEEQSLFAEISGDIGFALGALETEEARRRETHELARSEERFRSIVEGSPDAIFIQTEQKFAYLNPAAERLLGAARGQLIGTPVVDHVHPDYRAAAKERIRRLNEERMSAALVEIKFLRVNGAAVLVETAGVPIVHEGKTGALVFLRDLSRRLDAETARDASEERYRLVSENANDVIWLFDLAADRFAYISPSIEKLSGYTIAEAMAQSLRDASLPGLYSGSTDSLSRRLARFAEGDDAASVDTLEVVQTRKDGSDVPVEVVTSLVAGADRRVTHVQGVARDIGARRRAEEALQESENRFGALVEAAPDAILVHSDGQLVYANPAMARLVGARGPEELLGTDLMSLVAPEFHDAVRSRIRFQRDTGRPAPPMEQEYVRRDGGRIAVESAAMPLRYRNRDAHLVFIRDITARQRAEGERAQLQAQLLQAQKMESVGRLAGGVAHDFNNILTVQQGWCEMLARGLRSDDPIAHGLAQIGACAERAAALTRQLLAFSRKQTLQPRVVDLNALVTNLDSMLRRLIGEDVDLRTVPAPEPVRVMADPGQVEQVLVNLAVNARDAMPDGGKLTIEVSSIELDEAYAAGHVDVAPGRYAMLAISDTGVGMSEDTRRHIFEPFFTTKGEGKGTGLGLSTVYGIVRQSGGDVHVYSEAGRGTTFRVYLPGTGARPAAATAAVAEITRGQGELVLVVEDEPALRELARLIIQDLGYQVSVADNGGAALFQVEEQGLRPELILTDVVMPGMSGRVLVERLRWTLPGVKVIYMSGYTDDAIVHHGVLDADVDFLQKPFSVTALATKLSSVLKKAGQ